MKTTRAIQETDAGHVASLGNPPTGSSQTPERRHPSAHGSIPQNSTKGTRNIVCPFLPGSRRLDDPCGSPALFVFHFFEIGVHDILIRFLVGFRPMGSRTGLSPRLLAGRPFVRLFRKLV
jgi:hypothetical protein